MDINGIAYDHGYCDTCGTCGTSVLRDPDTLAEVHLDVTYQNCGVEGEVTALADRIDGIISIPQPRKRHLRAL